jgi:hypothetical protein
VTYYGDTYGNSVAALPTGETMNPLIPSGARYFDQRQMAYVLFKVNEARTRPTRIFTSFGRIDGWKIGTHIHLEHEQTQRYLGEYEIVGVHDFMSGEMAGDVPDIKLKHCVAK